MTRRDAMATVFVVAAAVLYVLWAAGVETAGLSEVKVVSGLVLGFGFVASASAVVLWLISTIRHAAIASDATRGSRPGAAGPTSRAAPGTP